ncbi:MAG: NAD(P)H-dependent oxidoreductase [Chloroflexi bacterium]|nr:NAD(P)H-dependent oxidoreductase [Chloroflexota bacterium]MCY3936804.1 NAD(P)H-dependent oxidoreductase [Chloroflexota bacterium]
MRLLGISGSLRRGSFNTALLNEATDLLPEDLTLEVFPLHDIPLFNSDVEARGFPPAVQAFRQRIRAADGLLFAAPEYNYSITGVLKNAIDWASRGENTDDGADLGSPLDEKPVAVMGAGGRLGTVRAQAHFRQIALHNSMRVMIDPELFVPRPWSKFDEDGRLVHERTRERLRKFLAAIPAWVRMWQANPIGS